jgi:Flp pilus assembly protein TadD
MLLVFLGLVGCHSPNAQRMPEEARSSMNSINLTTMQKAEMKTAYGRMMERRGDDVEAAEAYKEALVLNPQDGEAAGRLAIFADKQGLFTESAKLYDKALAARPGNPEVFANMGYSLYLQRRWAEAEMNLRQALAVDPRNVRARNNLGLALAQRGETKAALEEFAKAGCSRADAHVNVAYVLTLKGQWDQARQQYQAAKNADPNSIDAAKGLQELDSLLARASQWPEMGGQAVAVSSH